MANKIHLRATVGGRTVCASRPGLNANGKVRRNGRDKYRTIPSSHVVDPETFRATPDADRCAHCADRFTATMNARRTRSGKPLYANAFTKELA